MNSSCAMRELFLSLLTDERSDYPHITIKKKTHPNRISFIFISHNLHIAYERIPFLLFLALILFVIPKKESHKAINSLVGAISATSSLGGVIILSFQFPNPPKYTTIEFFTLS